VPKEIYHSEPISIPEVKQLLIARAKDGDELSYMQRIALEHAQLVTKISAESAKSLIEELMEKFRLSDKAALTLANFMPNTIDEIRQLLGKEIVAMETETVEEILESLLAVELLDEMEKAIDIDEIEGVPLEDEEKEIDESMVPEDLR
jgi:DNA-directed RNA polymerase subunit F